LNRSTHALLLSPKRERLEHRDKAHQCKLDIDRGHLVGES